MQRGRERKRGKERERERGRDRERERDAERERERNAERKRDAQRERERDAERERERCREREIAASKEASETEGESKQEARKKRAQLNVDARCLAECSPIYLRKRQCRYEAKDLWAPQSRDPWLLRTSRNRRTSGVLDRPRST